ncbi:Cys-tRNA(Pro) deacylase [Fusobacterium simiae]|uniref:Cys-tRNA(Pro)/Cys-tRNA(Cys) deacylase n=1 Tax=Fusobacterium simiae TaxID=855 RepID=A0ABT4DL66_FUSSI|nr:MULTISPECIES: Cys-tRNA(Pro) deacylase [Fusobacterium]MCY7008029.1 Cys-tRNA(Pro) deacylase [Fusobacterium simiae]MDC7955437.1 Cys-tRNA(Pro) deacylase [Fusobacterium simiae]
MKKTNAIRELEIHKIEHKVIEYEVDEEHLDAVSVALKTNEDITRVFKTLILLNEKREMVVACVPGMEKLDLKKLAKLSNHKRLEMLPMKELLSMTGYVRGGCSPVGIKKRHTTFIHKTALDNKTILVSGGLRGLQIEIEPQKLIDYLKMIVGDIIEDVEIKNIAISD